MKVFLALISGNSELQVAKPGAWTWPTSRRAYWYRSLSNCCYGLSGTVTPPSDSAADENHRSWQAAVEVPCPPDATSVDTSEALLHAMVLFSNVDRAAAALMHRRRMENHFFGDCDKVYRRRTGGYHRGCFPQGVSA